ncbi:MAG: hypothetical protein JW705_05840 [Methanosarcinaceae archaeon]|nr:hypothetical protein [Methanosarcinaceae archaeon]
MQYNRYLLAGVILLMAALFFMFAEFMSESPSGSIDPEDTAFLNIDTLGKAILVGLPPVIAGLYVLTRHWKKKTDD